MGRPCSSEVISLLTVWHWHSSVIIDGVLLHDLHQLAARTEGYSLGYETCLGNNNTSSDQAFKHNSLGFTFKDIYKCSLFQKQWKSSARYCKTPKEKCDSIISYHSHQLVLHPCSPFPLRLAHSCDPILILSVFRLLEKFHIGREVVSFNFGC